MRKIKFRAKRASGYTGGRKWLFGGIIPDMCGEWHIMTASMDCETVEQDTVGEFTGLTDKNGVEIYEGDIVVDVPLPTRLNPRALKGVVKFGTYRNSSDDMIEAQGFYIEWLNDELEFSQKSLPYWAESVSVCGNVHDNPELLNN